MEEWNGTALTDEFYLLEYIEENFRNYMDDNGNGTAQGSRMAEEKESIQEMHCCMRWSI